MPYLVECEHCYAPIHCPDGPYRWTVMRCTICGLNTAVRNPQPRNVDLEQRRKDYYDQLKLLS